MPEVWVVDKRAVIVEHEWHGEAVDVGRRRTDDEQQRQRPQWNDPAGRMRRSSPFSGY
jgi:hypothetical protein